ncbi:MAG: hypothetical protein HY077_10120 [Elusimicrobia bacterium]|nr:hypothetical protein [Elusimicrobiota bacterium]
MLRFWLATLALRLRFFTGKASFVEADVEMTTNQLADVSNAPGAAPERRLLAHYRLKTRKPHSGGEGWRLFRDRAGAAGTDQLVALACGFCGHFFVVQVLSALDPLASEATRGRPPAQPASYASDWFEFMHSDYSGTPSLYCLRCETDGSPRVKYLAQRPPPAA